MNIYIPDTQDVNRWVSERFSILAEIVQEYDPALELRWIPPANRTRDDKKPYVVVDTRTNYPVQYASELDNPQEVLISIIQSDNRNECVLTRLEASEAANRLFQMKEWNNKLEEAYEEVKFLMKSPLNWIDFNGKKLDDQRRIIGSSKEAKHL